VPAHPLLPEQHAVLRAIARCRTAALGGYADVCARCGHTEVAYRSCRNRHCPKCQALAQARWVEQRMERVLPTHFFHVVFTLPSELHPLARTNREALFNMLLASAAETLMDLGRDPKRLGAELGITTVLHTWTRALLSGCKHLLQSLQNPGDGGFWKLAEASNEPLSVDGANLIEDNLAGLSLDTTGNPERRRAAGGREWSDDGSQQVRVELVRGDDNAGSGLLDFSAPRWIEAD